MLETYKKLCIHCRRMDVVFLGTSSMQPTADRNLLGILVSQGSERILIDCGEGTQRQMKIAKIAPTKITRILITHNHTDHTLGLGGLVRNLAANQYSGKLQIYGPKGIKKTYLYLVEALNNRLDLNVQIHEIKEGKVFSTKDVTVNAYKLDHSTPCLGYSIKEKDKRKINLSYIKKFGLVQDPILGKLQSGKDITYKGKKITSEKGTKLIKGKKLSVVLDTRKCDGAIKAAKSADLLICESTYGNSEEMKATDRKHLTAGHAAEIAVESEAKKLILTHFSQRYKSVNSLKREAKKIFKNVICAEDFMKVKV